MKPVILSSFGPPALACIRSWGKQGWHPGMICIRSENESEPTSRYLSAWTTLPRKKVFAEEGIGIVAEFLRRFEASGIICIEEKISCWINEHRGLFPGKTAIWLPDNRVLSDVLSKKRQTEIAKTVGFDVLPTYLLSPKTDISVKSEHFPLCLRPSEPGSASFKAHIVSSQKELAEFLGNRKEIRSDIIGQPFKSLPNLVVHGARTRSGAAIGLRGFLVPRKFEGVTLTIRPIALDDDLCRKCVEFADAFDIVGNYHFEFLHDPETNAPYFLEINTRFGGTTAKVMSCGYDEPLLALECYGVRTDNVRQAIRQVTVSDKQALAKYLFRTLTARPNPLDYPEEPKLTRICETIRAFAICGDDVLNFSDIRGSIGLYWGNLMTKMMALISRFRNNSL